MAIIIKSDGSEETITLDSKTSLKVLQEAVGGNIEMLHTKDGRYIFCNENGRNMDLKKNNKATDLWHYGEHDYIVGDVVVCEKQEVESDD